MRQADKRCDVETLHGEARELTEAELATICAGAGAEGQGNMGGTESSSNPLGSLTQLLGPLPILGGLGGSLGNLGGGGGAL
ncbi:MAG TPA: hypothetical protein VFN35_10490 [Ktedonobacteraceae bacterium]|nr:hypothetical protein [Ktedonobacteraceae bacterium]